MAHALEDCFVAVQEQRCRLWTRHVDRMLQAVDLLSRISLLSEAEFAAWTVAHADEVEATVDSLKSILTDQSDPPSTPPPTTAEPSLNATHPQSQDLSGFSLLDLFRAEAEGHTATISQGLLGLEGISESESRDDRTDDVRGDSLKGAARIVGLDAAVGVAHALEDCFVAVQEGRCRLEPPHIDILLNAVDFINSISVLPENEFMSWLIAHETEVQNVVSSVQSVLNATESAAPSESASPPVPPPPKVDPPARVAPKPPEPAPAVEPAAPALSVAPEAADRVVRVTAESLTRLMGLAGEALVQSRQLRPFVDSLMMLKRQHSALLDTLQILIDRADVTNGAGVVRELLTRGSLRPGNPPSLERSDGGVRNFARRTRILPAACITKC